MSPDRPPRISEGERDTVVERLKEAFAEGHLSSEEMDERLHAALSATTPGEVRRRYRRCRTRTLAARS